MRPPYHNTDNIVPEFNWRSWLSMAGSEILRFSWERRGFFRIRRFLQKVLSRILCGYYVPVRYFTGKIWVNISHWGGSRVFNRGVYEPGTIRLIQTACMEGYSFIDVGAHVGTHLIAAALAPRKAQVRLVGFEPEPKTFSVLTHNIQKNGFHNFIDTYCLALAEEEGRRSFYTGNDPGGNGFLLREGYCVRTEVSTKRFDSISNIDFPEKVLIKIDVEGGEMGVLKGAYRFLRDRPDVAIIMEYRSNIFRIAGLPQRALTDWLKELSFGFWKIEEEPLRLIHLDPNETNACNIAACRSIPETWIPFISPTPPSNKGNIN